jgi:hypothetical protein
MDHIDANKLVQLQREMLERAAAGSLPAPEGAALVRVGAVGPASADSPPARQYPLAGQSRTFPLGRK